MIPPRFVPPGVLQLIEVEADGSKTLLEEFPTSAKNRNKLESVRRDLLMLNPTRNLFTSENNAQQFNRNSGEHEDVDLFLELPDDILETVGWTQGDTLNVEVIGNRIVLTRVPQESL